MIIKESFEHFSKFIRFGCVFYCIKEYIGEISMCIGPSMLPTFNLTGDILLLEKISPLFRGYKKGDVIISTSPTNLNTTICKRIIALEGEKVFIKHRFDSRKHFSKIIPKGHVWLEGDNQLNSTDSRTYGPVPLALIRGRVFMRIWPLNQVHFIQKKV